MLKIAKNEFNKDKKARTFMITADEVLLFFGMGKENYTYLKKELEVLNRTQVVYNILGKNKRSQESGAFTLISEFKYKQGMITYSIALYELAEDYLNAQIPKMSTEKFRELMGIKEHQYSKFATLKKNVIDIAIEEINDRENIGFSITYELDKIGRKTTHIKFIIHKKENTLQTGEKQKNFYRWKNIIVKKYKE